MPTAKKKVIFYATPEIQRWLEEQAALTGAPVAEVCRRAIQKAMAPVTPARPGPVLFTPRQETR
jgi:hypothetical protein